ncbi:MAG: HIT family protein [Pseudomonadaceae bacterium]|nr:HIT family protein [Pseudomonadaceae bacterium]
MSTFVLHERLAADTSVVCELPFSRCLLMHDARYPWLILVPRMADLRDLHEVPAENRQTLFDEIDQVSQALIKLTDAYKINVAALGNQVPQLHIHVIARQQDDDAWPGPVWGVGEATPYADVELLKTLQNLTHLLTTTP